MQATEFGASIEDGNLIERGDHRSGSCDRAASRSSMASADYVIVCAEAFTRCAPFAPLVTLLCSFGHGVLEASCCWPISRVMRRFSGNDGVCIVTGGSGGIGFEVARILLQQGHAVLILCRVSSKGQAAAARLRQLTGSSACESFHVDLADLLSVHEFVQEMMRRNVSCRALVNTVNMVSADALAVNYLGQFALTLGLLPVLHRASRADDGRRTIPRIINMASSAHVHSTFSRTLGPSLAKFSQESGVCKSAWTAYADSQLANIFFSLAISRRLTRAGRVRCDMIQQGAFQTELLQSPSLQYLGSHGELLRSGLSHCCSCVHPRVAGVGIVSTAVPRLFFECICQEEGACYLESCLVGSSGTYFQQYCCCVIPVRAAAPAYDRRLQDEIWKLSMGIISTTAPELMKDIDANVDDWLTDEHDSGMLTSAAWPLTEVLGLAPACCCLPWALQGGDG